MGELVNLNIADVDFSEKAERSVGYILMQSLNFIYSLILQAEKIIIRHYL